MQTRCRGNVITHLVSVYCLKYYSGVRVVYRANLDTALSSTQSRRSVVPFEVAAIIGQHEGAVVVAERKVVEWLRLNSMKDPHMEVVAPSPPNVANAVIGSYDGTVGVDPRYVGVL